MRHLHLLHCTASTNLHGILSGTECSRDLLSPCTQAGQTGALSFVLPESSLALLTAGLPPGCRQPVCRPFGGADVTPVGRGAFTSIRGGDWLLAEFYS